MDFSRVIRQITFNSQKLALYLLRVISSTSEPSEEAHLGAPGQNNKRASRSSGLNNYSRDILFTLASFD